MGKVPEFGQETDDILDLTASGDGSNLSLVDPFFCKE
jgi:hypothetical protein